MSPRLVLAGSLAGVALVAAAAAPAAVAAPKCSGATAGAVHEAEEAASQVPVAGKTVAGVLHGPVEDAACRLP
jgi:hypothetical protein